MNWSEHGVLWRAIGAAMEGLEHADGVEIRWNRLFDDVEVVLSRGRSPARLCVLEMFRRGDVVKGGVAERLKLADAQLAPVPPPRPLEEDASFYEPDGRTDTRLP